MWKLEHRCYRLPFRVPIRTAYGVWTVREGVLIRATKLDEEGRAVGAVGWGEAAPIAWFGSESVERCERVLAGLGGRVEDLSEALARVPADCPAVRAGLAAALTEDGGWVDEQAADASGVAVDFLSVAALLPAGRAVLGAVEERLEAGFRTFKWKVGLLPPAEELPLLDDLLGELPAGVRVRLDANGAWDRRAAERWLAAAAERPAIEYIEQPVATADARGEDLLLGLAEDYPVTLALDESVGSAVEVERWLAQGWRGVWVIKPSLLGEPGPVLERLFAAQADVVFGSALETAVGAVAGVKLAFSWAARSRRPVAERRALGYGVWPLFAEVRAEAPWRAPFLRREDLARIEPEALWNALV